MKKSLSILLVLALLCAALPVSFAADTWVCPTCGRENEKNFCPKD